MNSTFIKLFSNKIFIVILIVFLGFFLRIIDVSNDPPGLYSDEVSIGYNAYTILTTGKDEYGISDPLWFRAYGEYKMPVYIYSVAATMAIWGKNEFSIRLPSIVAGTFTILILYLFLEKIVSLEKDKQIKIKLRYVPLLASFLLAISTWHLQFSRGGFEVTLGTFFYLLGSYLYLLFRQKRNFLVLAFSLIAFIIAVYTYDTFRILSPIALLFIAYDQQVYKNKNSLLYVIGVILCLAPIFLFSLTQQGSERFATTSAFTQFKYHSLLLQLFEAPIIYLDNYLSFFSFDFLFSFGDGIGRHQVQDFGELYRWQIPFFISGLYYLFKTKKSVIKSVTLLFFFTTPLAAAVALPSPHSLRALPMVIPCMIIISVGIVYLFQKIKTYHYKIIFYVLIIFFALFEFLLYLQFYYINYPQENLPDWGSGYKQLVIATSQIDKNYKYIAIDSTLSYATEYFHFYDPAINFIIVSPNWIEPQSWKNYHALYIRPYYGHKNAKKFIENINLPKKSIEIFAQIFKLQ